MKTIILLLLVFLFYEQDSFAQKKNTTVQDVSINKEHHSRNVYNIPLMGAIVVKKTPEEFRRKTVAFIKDEEIENLCYELEKKQPENEINENPFSEKK